MSTLPSKPEANENDEYPTGSPQGEPVFLVVAQIGKPHGVRGEILMTVLTDFPERLHQGTRVFVGEEHLPMRMAQVRDHQDKLVVRFHGVTSREEAEKLRGLLVYVKMDEIPELPEGEYYHHQLVGLNVANEAGELLGELAEILETGANDVLVVRLAAGGELLLPYNDECVLRVDLEARQIAVRVLPGLE